MSADSPTLFATLSGQLRCSIEHAARFQVGQRYLIQVGVERIEMTCEAVQAVRGVGALGVTFSAGSMPDYPVEPIEKVPA